MRVKPTPEVKEYLIRYIGNNHTDAHHLYEE